MKYLVFSDLHGSGIYAKKVIEKFNELKCDYMLCLGDILYHGPRNDLPLGYNPKEVISILNPYSKKIIAVKGNCEAYVDQMVLNFIIHDELDVNINNHRVIMTHGHLINPDKHLNVKDANILYGHTHIYKCDNIDGSKYLNPGSTTLPKGGCKNSFALIDGDKFIVYDFDMNILLEEELL